MFFGEKLKSVRELNGLSRKELGNKLSLSEQAIWQYENQYTAPKFEIANELKSIFNVKAQFFYTEPFIDNISKVENIAYRAKDRDARKKAKMETYFIDFTSYFLNEFESKLNLPITFITQLRDESVHIYNQQTGSHDKLLQLERIAENARKKLNLAENSELLYKLELSGIYILEKNIGSNIDAYSTWTSQDKPFIILGNKKKSAVRRNFDLAHELGHLLLHYRFDMDSLNKDEHKKVEQEANDFASFFLLPKEQFLEDFSTIQRRSNPDSYINLKMKYSVSISALEYRAYKLGLLSFEENRYFYATVNRKGYKKNEPLDEDIAVIRPGKIRSLLDLVFKNQLLSLDTILNNYHIDCSFLELLLGLDHNFLNKYSKEATRKYFNTSTVIPLFSTKN